MVHLNFADVKENGGIISKCDDGGVSMNRRREDVEEGDFNTNDSIEDECVQLSGKQLLKDWKKGMIEQQVFGMLKNSSLHGIPHIFDESYPLRRILWLLVTLVFFAYSAQKVYESTVRYFEYPFSTTRMRKYPNKLDFPAVSFCNMNDMKLSVLNGTVVDQAILDKNKSFTSEAYFNITALAVHQLEDMLVDCSFDGRKCSAKDFTEFYWKAGDKCYTFNSGGNGRDVFSVNGAGLKRGLKITVNIQHYDYYRDGQEAGIHLILHSQLETTPVKIIGQMLPPGYTTYVKVFKRKITNLKYPYKTDCGSIPLHYFDRYSMHLCWLEKLTDYVTERCNCKDFFMPGKCQICNSTQAKGCMWPKWEIFEKDKKYSCPLPCEIESFHATLSRSLFPLSSLNDTQYRLLNQSQVNGEKESFASTQFLRDNYLRFLVFYDDLSFEFLEQQPSYGTLVWLGDIGGQIGLFVGAGVLSYFEILDCLILMFYTYFFSHKNEKYVSNESDYAERHHYVRN